MSAAKEPSRLEGLRKLLGEAAAEAAKADVFSDLPFPERVAGYCVPWRTFRVFEAVRLNVNGVALTRQEGALGARRNAKTNSARWVRWLLSP